MVIDEAISRCLDENRQGHWQLGKCESTDSDWYKVELATTPRFEVGVVADILTVTGLLVRTRLMMVAYDREMDTRRDCILVMDLAGQISRSFHCILSTKLKSSERLSEVQGIDRTGGVDVDRTLYEFIHSIPLDLDVVISTMARGLI